MRFYTNGLFYWHMELILAALRIPENTTMAFFILRGYTAMAFLVLRGYTESAFIVIHWLLRQNWLAGF